MLQGADEQLARADGHADRTHLPPRQPLTPSSPPASSPPASSSQVPSSPPPSSAPLSSLAPAPAAADLVAQLAGGEARPEFAVPREIRAAAPVGASNTAP